MFIHLFFLLLSSSSKTWYFVEDIFGHWTEVWHTVNLTETWVQYVNRKSKKNGVLIQWLQHILQSRLIFIFQFYKLRKWNKNMSQFDHLMLLSAIATSDKGSISRFLTHDFINIFQGKYWNTKYCGNHILESKPQILSLMDSLLLWLREMEISLCKVSGHFNKLQDILICQFSQIQVSPFSTDSWSLQENLLLTANSVSIGRV